MTDKPEVSNCRHCNQPADVLNYRHPQKRKYVSVVMCRGLDPVVDCRRQTPPFDNRRDAVLSWETVVNVAVREVVG